jgi:hypothetical protein
VTMRDGEIAIWEAASSGMKRSQTRRLSCERDEKPECLCWGSSRSSDSSLDFRQ